MATRHRVASCATLIVIIAAVSLVSDASFYQSSAKVLPDLAQAAGGQASISPPPMRMTTLDLRQEYEILGIVTHYQELGFGITGDPLEGAIRAGLPRFEEKARKLGATAIVGVRLEFENPSAGRGQEGRLLIYGTAVKTP